MNRIALSVCAVVLVASTAYVRVNSSPAAQRRCTMTEASMPAIRGVRLGMSLQQVLALFPESGKRRGMTEVLDKAKSLSNNDPVLVSFEPATDASGQTFAGIDSVAVTFHKQRVVEFNVSYVGTTWGSVDEWIAKLSETLGLPGAKDWMAGPSENPNKVLRCQGIEIEAAIQGGGSSVRIQNAEYQKMTHDRTDGEEAKKRKEFKP